MGRAVHLLVVTSLSSFRPGSYTLCIAQYAVHRCLHAFYWSSRELKIQPSLVCIINNGKVKWVRCHAGRLDAGPVVGFDRGEG